MKLSKYINKERVEGRQCGDCYVCCVLPRIKAVAEGKIEKIVECGVDVEQRTLSSLPLLPEGKPGFTPCQFLSKGTECEAGCLRYDERPPVCSDFECLWRDGTVAGDERRRPDNLGLMLTYDVVDGKVYVDVWEVWEGAASEHPGRGVMDALEPTGLVLLRFYGVPVSLAYKGPKTLELGRKLSQAAREDPKRLAAWCREKASHYPDKAAQLDLEFLERGEPVVAHFSKKKAGGASMNADQEMYEKGYRYRCDPVDTVASPYVPLYAKDLKMVSLIHRDWPKQRFNVVKLDSSSQEGGR